MSGDQVVSGKLADFFGRLGVGENLLQLRELPSGKGLNSLGANLPVFIPGQDC
jgi:hypothetical protein